MAGGEPNPGLWKRRGWVRGSQTLACGSVLERVNQALGDPGASKQGLSMGRREGWGQLWAYQVPEDSETHC